MTGVHKNGVTNKAREAYRLICWIVILIIIILAIFCFVTRKSSPSVALEINSFSSIEPSGAIYKQMEVTAYCPCEICCGEFTDEITASGVDVNDFYGLLIAAPPEYSFGTVMDIPGYGIATVQDRGGAIQGNRLDVYFSTHQEALNWGRQKLKVKIINPKKEK